MEQYIKKEVKIKHESFRISVEKEFNNDLYIKIEDYYSGDNLSFISRDRLLKHYEIIDYLVKNYDKFIEMVK